MIRNLKYFIIHLLLLASMLAHAGGENSGGGGSRPTPDSVSVKIQKN
jgi:hypothetical protein